jgi:TrmH family RNA methyltransferase
MTITSPHNPLLKRARALLTRKGRAAQAAFLVEGPRAIATVLAAGARLEAVLVEPEAAAPELHGQLAAAGLEPILCAAGLLAEVCETETPQGWLAIVRAPSFEGWATPPDRLLVLDGVQDPGNVGTLLRTADAVGAGVILAAGCADPLSPKVVRASAGAVVRVPWRRLSVAEARNWLTRIGREVIVLDSAGGEELSGAPLPWPLALVAGSEAHGPSAAWDDCPRRRLPMRPGAESLNVAIAAAVALYESVRQHGTGDDGA